MTDNKTAKWSRRFRFRSQRPLSFVTNFKMAMRCAAQLWPRLRLLAFSSAFGPARFYFALLNASGSYLNTFSIRAAAVITQSRGGRGGNGRPHSRLSFLGGRFPFSVAPTCDFHSFLSFLYCVHLQYFIIKWNSRKRNTKMCSQSCASGRAEMRLKSRLEQLLTGVCW